MSRERYVPLITVVIGGTIGTLQDILDALDSSGGGAVVLVRDSGGCSQAAAEFLEDVRAYERRHEESTTGRTTRASLDKGTPRATLEDSCDAVMRTFIERDRIEKWLIRGQGYEDRDAKQREAEGLLLKIGKHPRQRHRLEIFSAKNERISHLDTTRGAEPLGTAFDATVLEAIVSSIEFDAKNEAETIRRSRDYVGAGGRRCSLFHTWQASECRREHEEEDWPDRRLRAHQVVHHL